MTDANIINPFLNATINVVKTMCYMEVKPGKPFVKKMNNPQGDVTGIIGLASDAYKGSMAIIFAKDVALAVVSGMLMGEVFEDITEDVVDAVGELTNMISGGAKREFSEQGLKFDMALPSMITGHNHSVHHQAKRAPIICIPFDVEAGTFWVEACLVKQNDE